MRIHVETRQLTSQLRHPAHAAVARALLLERPWSLAIEAAWIWELDDPVSEEGAQSAARGLSSRATPAARDALRRALCSESGPIRLAALRSLAAMEALESAELERIVRQDEAPLVRRVALHRARVHNLDAVLRTALDDPVWRVRRVAVQALAEVGRLPSGTSDDPRVEGAIQYMERLNNPDLWQEVPPQPAPAPRERASWWREDPAVLLETYRQLSFEARLADFPAALSLLEMQDGYPLDGHLRSLRAAVLESLERCGTLEQLCAVFERLDAPRIPFLAQALRRFFSRPSHREIGLERYLGDPRPRLRRAALRLASPSREQKVTLALSDPDEVVRIAALASLHGHELELDALLKAGEGRDWIRAVGGWAASTCNPATRTWLETLHQSPDAELRRAAALSLEEGAVLEGLRQDPNPRVREAALREESAAELLREPQSEPAWRVLLRAAHLCGQPPEVLGAHAFPAPSPLLRTRSFWTPSRIAASCATWTPPAALEAHPSWRALPGTELRLSPLLLSGRYGLSEPGFRSALETGVNAFFWEPTYGPQTRFLRTLPKPLKDTTVVMSGSFEAEPGRVRADVEQTLRVLERERIEIFVLFWVREQERLSHGVLETLLGLQARGHIATFGLSTHSRSIARSALEDGWPLLMMRHSAAHRASEEEVLPHLPSRAAAIGFTTLCYGRMLQSRGGVRPPYTAADCYRYSLSQPGISAVLSAPRNGKELRHNLTVLERPALSLAEQERMRNFVSDERLRSRHFKRLLTQRGS